MLINWGLKRQLEISVIIKDYKIQLSIRFMDSSKTKDRQPKNLGSNKMVLLVKQSSLLKINVKCEWSKFMNFMRGFR